ncbi:hypothetical protein PYW07_014771 [Mythimna separata]|uniref:Uncharacterized protein n=1 Tax=Mythimna separata TaxID=271217 RepID=A0AAD7Z0E0_MYTSE|nr:hypothetical protein PYW07_014771 [Mythimna separata]
MKKVRFESPVKVFKSLNMNERECHSPRPLIERQLQTNIPELYGHSKVLPYSNDPVQLFECSNSSPYPIMNKTPLPVHQKGPDWLPTNELELSMLDASYHEPRKPTFCRSILKPADINHNTIVTDKMKHVLHMNSQKQSPIGNETVKPPNVLIKDNDFFIKRDNLDKFHLDMNPLQKQLGNLSLDKENNPFTKKSEIVQMAAISRPENLKHNMPQPTGLANMDCSCHHCIQKVPSPSAHYITKEPTPHHHLAKCEPNFYVQNATPHNQCPCKLPPPPRRCSCCNHTPPRQYQCDMDQVTSPKMNAVDKKTWAIEKYEQTKKSDSMEVEKQTNVSKEKREPTVSDVFKIIKLQNEQLQLLQEKVDKFISASQQPQPPAQIHTTEHVAIETVGKEQHKISIGVMTSFEMVRTSTVINKEILKTNDNAQIQCNRSQISIKEVLSKGQSPNPNFLDGIAPVGETMRAEFEAQGNAATNCLPGPTGVNEEKTLNELSLYNVHIDNATTPLMSPEQSLYLDIRDYSDSEAGSDDQSNVGWTYYNKVMTHVNGMLQDSDMPSSASALYKNTRQQMQTVQMQIDKTNVSVTKRVKFGDDPLGLHQPHIYASTDTSLKMNQLAAKYLKNGPPVAAPQRLAPRPAPAPIDMSFATRNYMERHKLLQGIPPSSSSKPATPGEMPRFLDITALKQQPKFL